MSEIIGHSRDFFGEVDIMYSYHPLENDEMSNTGGLKNPLHSWNLWLLDKRSISRTAYLPAFLLLIALVPGFVALGSPEYYRTFASCFCVGFLQINTVSSRISCFAVLAWFFDLILGRETRKGFKIWRKNSFEQPDPNCWHADEPIIGMPLPLHIPYKEQSQPEHFPMMWWAVWWGGQDVCCFFPWSYRKLQNSQDFSMQRLRLTHKEAPTNPRQFRPWDGYGSIDLLKNRPKLRRPRHKQPGQRLFLFEGHPLRLSSFGGLVDIEWKWCKRYKPPTFGAKGNLRNLFWILKFISACGKSYIRLREVILSSKHRASLVPIFFSILLPWALFVRMPVPPARKLMSHWSNKYFTCFHWLIQLAFQ